MIPAPSNPDLDSSSPCNPYEALLERLRQRLVPFTVFWELTHRCNLHCRMCYNVPRPRPELSTDEALSLLPQLVEAGTLQLVLTGGEILTRPDFFTIAESARSLGFALLLKTNGTLITPTLADHIAALAPVRVDISLLSATASTCATLTAFPQALTHITRGVKLLRERDVHVHLYTLLMQSNLAEREQMAALAGSLGVSYEQVYALSPDDDGQHRALAEQLNRSQISALFDAESSPVPSALTAHPCSVALSGCLISPYGIVYPCTELRIPAGDLRRQSFLTIWQDAPIFAQLRQVHTWQNLPDCHLCSLRNHCHGRCAGLAWKEQGDFLAGHTLACYQAQARFTHHPHESPPSTPYLQRIRGANAL